MKGKMLLLLLLIYSCAPLPSVCNPSPCTHRVRHHVLNATYVIRRRDGSSSSENISGQGARLRLRQLLTDVFHIAAPDSNGLYTYLDA